MQTVSNSVLRCLQCTFIYKYNIDMQVLHLDIINSPDLRINRTSKFYKVECCISKVYFKKTYFNPNHKIASVYVLDLNLKGLGKIIKSYFFAY